jgi:heme/copper-type cytochrome/quinol oxidase subunit 4
MESSGPSRKAPQTSEQLWAKVVGTIIAVLTLTLPLWVTAYYSSESEMEIMPSTTYSLPSKSN